MRRNPTKQIEQYRIKHGRFGTSSLHGANGAFQIPYEGVLLNVIASDGRDWDESDLPLPAWEHVSVSLGNRCPTWEEMDFVKRIFWRDDELAIQMHVPRERHVNHHRYCLHLWKPVGVMLPMPPEICVGPT